MINNQTLIFRTVLGLLVAVALILGGPTSASSPLSEAVSEAPVASQEVTAGNTPLSFDRVPVKTVPAPEKPVDPVAWVHGVAADAGLSFGGVDVQVTSVDNCGMGCTNFGYLDRVNRVAKNPIWVKIQPSIIGTEYGKFVVLHELGHVQGIFNECEADQFAINHGATPFRDAHC